MKNKYQEGLYSVFHPLTQRKSEDTLLPLSQVWDTQYLVMTGQ